MALYLGRGSLRSAVCKARSAVVFAKSQPVVSVSTEKTQPTSKLPDFNTSVKIHEHKLRRATRPPPKWDALKDLKENTKGSLIPETLKQMEEDEEFKLTAAKLRKIGLKSMTREERKQRQRALDRLNVPNFTEFWNQAREKEGKTVTERVVKKKNIVNFGINAGLYCNQACNHCHVESSPKRQEVMSREIADRCLWVIENSPSIQLVDITGGAPELCPEFRHLVTGARRLGRDVIDRCNLTSLLEPGQEDTIDFLKENKVTIVASLPCYTSKNVNMQRGKGVFAKSIQALLLLNEAGFGEPDSDLKLHLVYNPLGNYLPPPQSELQLQYKKQLMEDFGIVFNDLFTMVNMPIKRFNDFLYRRNELEEYMEMLVRNFNLKAVDGLMCRDSVTVNWDGQVYDCDFNGQMEMHLNPLDEGSKNVSIYDIKSVGDLENHTVNNDSHCFGCAAGMGSS